MRCLETYLPVFRAETRMILPELQKYRSGKQMEEEVEVHLHSCGRNGSILVEGTEVGHHSSSVVSELPE